MDHLSRDPGANASQDSTQVVETIEEEIEEVRPRRYELDPEPDSGAESPPAGEEKADSKTPEEERDRNPIHDRINKLTENWRTAERSSNELMLENEELRRRLQGTGPPEQGQQPAGQPIESDEIPPRKTLADFDYDDAAYMDYVEQRNEAIINKRTAESWQNKEKEAAAQQRRQAHLSREAEFMKDVKDYATTVSQVPVTPQMLTMIESSEVGPDLVYYLGKNPNVATAIVQSDPLEMARKVALIEYEIKAAKDAVSGGQTVSKAPAPTKKVRGTDPGKVVTASDPDSDKLSDEEWLKRRKREVKANSR